MTTIHHLDCGLLETGLGRACCHCIALRTGDRVALIDCGIGLLDCADPEGRLGRELIDGAGFRFDQSRTAVRQLQAIGVDRSRVTDVILTHADPDHTGGLADFPRARVHLAAEELAAVRGGHPRYLPTHFEHGPEWVEHGASGEAWHGVPARRVTLDGGVSVHLVELFGHTAGHCGVAIALGDGWMLHAGDAYYLASELDDPGHPVGGLAESRAHDNASRLRSLEQLRRLRRELGERLRMTGYHDIDELEASLE